MKSSSYILFAFTLIASILLVSCDKESDSSDKNNTCTECSDNSAQVRLAIQNDGYTEIEVNPIQKEEYFEEWDKSLMTPVYGLFEYYNADGMWVASIDYGDGTCDNQATKSWDTSVFPDNPEGSLEFSIFE
jgi:hypothetical protein